MKDVCIISKMITFGVFYAIGKVIDVNKKRRGPRTKP